MTDVRQTERRPSIVLRILGWILGAASLLNLIKDLNLVELYGKIAEWTAAYGLFVSRVGSFLFGWLEWRWFGVDALENHMLVIAALIGGAAGRAAYATGIRRGKEDLLAELVGTFLLFFVCAFFAALFIPSPYSLWVGSILVLLMAWGNLSKVREGQDAEIDFAEFRREAVIVGAGFLILILANYLIFRP
jgi:hypothetical protein